ncbi:MAG TPA: MFS transporter [Ignavibacteria bacterium]|nr:MFS transporter [Ignavibacteria bacterium]
MNESASKRNVIAIVIISALGYFVDIYDLILFSVVRIGSLKSLGVSDADLLPDGVLLLNMQMAGMLIGGIIWGIMGDKKGRISVLFGSIFLYSLANIANGFVQTIPQYAALRFIAGVGLAGELGAGITLVSEVMPKETRGYGTMLVATIGIFGAVVAAFIADIFQWRTAFFVGGGLGIVLLIMRIGVYESGMYNSIKQTAVAKGSFHKLFTDRRMFFKYLFSIFIGVPIWFIVGVLVTFSPEFAKAFGIQETISTGKAIMFCYIGLAAGDLLSGFLSQIFKTRKKIIMAFIALEALFVSVYLFLNILDATFLYAMCLMLGISGGYWAVFVTNASEQFGTNIRATVTTTVPNFVRGAVVPATLAFQYLTPVTGIVFSALIVGMSTLAIAFFSITRLEETYGKDLNYVEKH